MQFKWIIIIINIIMISLLLLFIEVLYSKTICHGPAINVVKRRCSQFQKQTRFILNLTLKMLSHYGSVSNYSIFYSLFTQVLCVKRK